MTAEEYYSSQMIQSRQMGFKRLLPINTDIIPNDVFEMMWDKIKDADYAFEDTTRGDKALFARNMLAPGTYNFEIPGEIFAQVVNAGPGMNAVVHFITLGTQPTAPMIDAAAELFKFVFTQLEVHRITAYVPSFNQKVQRLATLVRMKFEGQMRKAFLYNNEYWDLMFYGLLDSEWQRRG